jgi:hypothetical protein
VCMAPWSAAARAAAASSTQRLRSGTEGGSAQRMAARMYQGLPSSRVRIMASTSNPPKSGSRVTIAKRNHQSHNRGASNDWKRHRMGPKSALEIQKPPEKGGFCTPYSKHMRCREDCAGVTLKPTNLTIPQTRRRARVRLLANSVRT